MKIRVSVLAPPSGGFGGSWVLGFRGSVPARALGGGVSGGVLARFASETPLSIGPFPPGTPLRNGPFRAETPLTIGPFSTPAPASGFAAATSGRTPGRGATRRFGPTTGSAPRSAGRRTVQRQVRPRPP